MLYTIEGVQLLNVSEVADILLDATQKRRCQSCSQQFLGLCLSSIAAVSMSHLRLM